MLPPDGGDMTAEAVIALRCALTGADYRFLPEITGRKFTAKPWSDWRQRQTPFAPTETYANNFGLLLNTALILDGTIAFDADIDDADDAATAFAVLQASLGHARCVRRRANSPRWAALYQASDDPGRYVSLKGSDGAIEVFSGAKTKLSAFGWHVTKATNVWTRLTWEAVPGNVRRDELTAVSVAQCDAFLAEVADVLGDDVVQRTHIPGSAPDNAPEHLRARDIDELCAASAWVPNQGPCDWHAWNRMGMALYAGSGGDPRGFVAFTAWSAKNRASAHRDCLARWLAYGQCPPTAIGAGTVFKLARNHGYTPSPSSVRQWQAERQAQQRIANWRPTI